MAANTIDIVLEARNNVSGPASRATKSIDNLSAATKRATLGTNQYGKAVDGSTRGLSKFAKSGLQQTGYQVGDFAVQVSGGTSALQAFGQQGSQLFGIFGAGGAILGAGIAIVAALGNAYMKSRDEAKSFSQEVDELNQAFTAFNTLNKNVITDTAKLAQTYSGVTKEVRGLHKAQIEMAAFKLNEAMNQTVTALESEFNAFGMVRRAQERYNEKKEQGAQKLMMYQRAVNNAKTRMFELGEQMGLQRKETLALSETFAALSELDPFKEPVKSAELLQSLYDQITSKGLKELSKEVIASADGVLQFQSVLLEFAAKTNDEVTGLAKSFGVAQKSGNDLAQGIASSMGQSFSSIVKGTQSVNKAFQNMAASIIDQLFNVLIVQQLVGTVGTATTPGTGLAGIFSGTSARAIGGPVSKGQTYLVGERGPELFSPSSNGQIIPNNKMGGGVTVVNNLTVNSNNPAAVRSEIISMLPMIKEASKSAVLEASRRGGSYANSFGN